MLSLNLLLAALELGVPFKALLHLSSATRVLLVVRRSLDHPIPSFEGFLASSLVLLGDEGHLVLGDLREVFRAGGYCCRYCGEANTREELICARTGAALYFLAEVDAVTIRVLRSRYTVRTEQHLGAAVLAVLTGFTQCAGNGINTGAPFYMCHVVSAMLYLLPT